MRSHINVKEDHIWSFLKSYKSFVKIIFVNFLGKIILKISNQNEYYFKSALYKIALKKSINGRETSDFEKTCDIKINLN